MKVIGAHIVCVCVCVYTVRGVIYTILFSANADATAAAACAAF